MDTDNMGGLGELLAPILSDPETMEKLRQEAEKLGLSVPDAFGGSGGGSRQQSASPGPSSETPRGPAGTGSSGEASGGTGDAGNIGALFAKLMPLISGMSEEDDSTRLLRALRPFLSEKRGKKLDEASRMLTVMHLIKLLPDIMADQ